MNKEEAMKVLGYQLNMKDTDVYTPINYEAIETVLSELEKKDKEYEELTEASKELCKTVNLMKKVINEMAEQLAGLAIFDIEKDESLILGDKEEVKQYFKEKVEG